MAQAMQFFGFCQRSFSVKQCFYNHMRMCSLPDGRRQLAITKESQTIIL